MGRCTTEPLPSDIESVATKHNLTLAEAEALINSGDVSDEAVAAVKALRTVNHLVTVPRPAGLSHDLTAIDAAAAGTTLDPPSPEATEEEVAALVDLAGATPDEIALLSTLSPEEAADLRSLAGEAE